MVNSTLFSWAKFNKAWLSSILIATFWHLASVAEPALPVATKTVLIRGSWAHFQARACSRPPEPKIRIFIFNPQKQKRLG